MIKETNIKNSLKYKCMYNVTKIMSPYILHINNWDKIIQIGCFKNIYLSNLCMSITKFVR